MKEFNRFKKLTQVVANGLIASYEFWGARWGLRVNKKAEYHPSIFFGSLLTGFGFRSLIFWIWDLFDIWCLEFGIYHAGCGG